MSAFTASKSQEEAITDTIALALKLAAVDCEGWEKTWEKDGVVAGTRPTGDSTVCVRGQTTVPYSMLDVLRVALRKDENDPNIDHWDIVKKETPDVYYEHISFKAPWPVTPRDSYNLSWFRILDDGSVVVLSTGFPDESFPPIKKFVRSVLVCAGFILKPVPGGVLSTFLLINDPTGSIPDFVKKTVFKNAPSVVNTVHTKLGVEAKKLSSSTDVPAVPTFDEIAEVFNLKQVKA